jgi:hypothetical protein
MNRTYVGVTVEMSGGRKFVFTDVVDNPGSRRCDRPSAVARGVGAGQCECTNEAAKVSGGFLTVLTVEMSTRMTAHSISAAPRKLVVVSTHAVSRPSKIDR